MDQICHQFWYDFAVNLDVILNKVFTEGTCKLRNETNEKKRKEKKRKENSEESYEKKRKQVFPLKGSSREIVVIL